MKTPTTEFPVWRTIKGWICGHTEFDLVLAAAPDFGVEPKDKHLQSDAIARRAIELGLKLPPMEVLRCLARLREEKLLLGFIMNEYGEVCTVNSENGKVHDTFFHIGFHTDDNKLQLVFVRPRK